MAPYDGAVAVTIGAYEVIDTIGRGASTVVHLAEHVDGGRRVALKQLSPRLASWR
jgi:serine/threonine protein kinase